MSSIGVFEDLIIYLEDFFMMDGTSNFLDRVLSSIILYLSLLGLKHRSQAST
jgi:hypothetical protein